MGGRTVFQTASLFMLGMLVGRKSSSVVNPPGKFKIWLKVPAVMKACAALSSKAMWSEWASSVAIHSPAGINCAKLVEHGFYDCVGFGLYFVVPESRIA